VTDYIGSASCGSASSTCCSADSETPRSRLGDRHLVLQQSHRYANQLPQPVESLIVRLKAEKPHWGARKIRELLVRRLDGDVRVPAKSTIHAVLDRHGLVKRGGGPRHRARGTPLSEGTAPNDLWCADFKGEFKLGNGRYCYPLTVTDHASRFLSFHRSHPRHSPCSTVYSRSRIRSLCYRLCPLSTCYIPFVVCDLPACRFFFVIAAYKFGGFVGVNRTDHIVQRRILRTRLQSALRLALLALKRHGAHWGGRLDPTDIIAPLSALGRLLRCAPIQANRLAALSLRRGRQWFMHKIARGFKAAHRATNRAEIGIIDSRVKS
jgi:hypothetical protein